MIKKFLKDPLLHFIVIAGGIFLYASFSSDSTEEKTIVITQGRIEKIENAFLTRWNREPKPEEVENAINHFALNEMYVREARNLGMDNSDLIIDRRLLQKMNFLLEDIVSAYEPTEEVLKAYYQQNTDKYREQDVYDFKQMHYSIDRSEQEIEQDIASQQQRIAQAQPPQQGLTYLPGQLSAGSNEIARHFGEKFVTMLASQPLNTWVGPIYSHSGVHFVYIQGKSVSQVKPFDRVEDKVLRDWTMENLSTAKNEFEVKLRDSYNVVVEQGE